MNTEQFFSVSSTRRGIRPRGWSGALVPFVVTAAVTALGGCAAEQIPSEADALSDGLHHGLVRVGARIEEREYTVVDGVALVEGDIIVEPVTEENADDALWSEELTLKPNAYWPNKTVYYSYETHIGSRVHRQIKRAKSLWAKATDVKFVYNRHRPDRVKIFQRDTFACGRATLGYQGKWGSSIVFGKKNCSLGNVLHEFGHVLGARHEHARKDRDKYINIHWNNIKPAWKTWFRTHASRGDSERLRGTFDYRSIMIYGSFHPAGVAKNSRKPLMTRKNGSTWSWPSRLSTKDKRYMDAIY